MSAETELNATLLAASAVTALVSTRIYPDFVPPEANLPCVAYSMTDVDPVMTIHSSQPVAETVVFEVVCMAATRSGATSLGDAVKAALYANGFTPVPPSRRWENDFENQMFGTVLTVVKFANL
jgi:hypothetical protein